MRPRSRFWGIGPTPEVTRRRCEADRRTTTADRNHGSHPQGSIQTAPAVEAHLGSHTDYGAPAPSDRNSLTVGADGPILLHDVHFLNQMAHFNRERIPECNVHAKGSGALGTFETTEDVSAYTKAALFQPGVKTEMLARFSTVAGEQGSPDTWRDPCGFSLKFYRPRGTTTSSANDTPVFFVRDTRKFPHFIRSQKRMGGSGLRDNTMQWDLWSLNPESAHQVAHPMGDRGIPKTLRHMNGLRLAHLPLDQRCG